MSSSQDAHDRPRSSQIQRDPVMWELDDVDTEVPSCKPFSIREYVFSARGKHLSKNWPFHQRYIQVCRKHGVKDILPPFESPALVREREDKYLGPHDAVNVRVCSRDAVDDQHELLMEDMDRVVAGISWKLGLLSLTCRDEVNDDKVMEEHVLRVDKMAGDYKLEAIASSRYSAAAELWFPSLDFASEDRRHLLAEEGDLLFGASDMVGNVRISVTENLILENVPKSGVGSDVGCAAEESKRLTQKRHKSQRCKLKSRKKRCMVDICAKALPCTLEDLDKKNGTNWALDPSVMPYSIPDSDKVKKYLVKRDGRNKPSNLPGTKLLNNPESTNCKDNSLPEGDVSQTKQVGSNNTNRTCDASSEKQCLQMSVLRDCSQRSAVKLSCQRTKQDKIIGASACGHQNELVRLKVEELTGGQSQDRGVCASEMLRPNKRWLQKGCATDQHMPSSCVESRQKSPIVRTVKARPLTNTTNTGSPLENFARSVAQYKRKPRTVKRMRKVDSITSCVAVVKQTQDRSESELFQSEVTDLCHCSPRASVHSSNSYTQEGIDSVNLKEKKNLFPSISIFENGGNLSIEPSIDVLAMTCSPNNTFYDPFQPYLRSEMHHASDYHCTHEIHGGGGKSYGLEGAFFDEISTNRMTGSQLVVEDKAKDCQGIVQEDQCELKPKDSVSSVVTTSSSNSLNGSVRSDNQPARSLSLKWLEMDGKCCTCCSDEDYLLKIPSHHINL
ncbi:uncharacterized protein LOC116251406 isoform X2 [Nymphaea colorata]|nr:uncharacterized protein LOC116251406 isoform X2 [Nymphaea colorata]